MEVVRNTSVITVQICGPLQPLACSQLWVFTIGNVAGTHPFRVITNTGVETLITVMTMISLSLRLKLMSGPAAYVSFVTPHD